MGVLNLKGSNHRPNWPIFPITALASCQKSKAKFDNYSVRERDDQIHRLPGGREVLYRLFKVTVTLRMRKRSLKYKTSYFYDSERWRKFDVGFSTFQP